MTMTAHTAEEMREVSKQLMENYQIEIRGTILARALRGESKAMSPACWADLRKDSNDDEAFPLIFNTTPRGSDRLLEMFINESQLTSMMIVSPPCLEFAPNPKT